MIPVFFLVMVPALAAPALWLIRSGRLRARVDLGVCALAFLLAVLLPIAPATASQPFGADEVTVLTALLISGIALLRRWHTLRQIGRSGLRRAAEQLGLGGMLLAACATHPLLLWGAFTVIAVAVSLPALPRGRDRSVAMAAGLSLALFGLVVWQAQPTPLAGLGLLVGFGGVALLTRDAPVLLLLLLLRLHALALGLPRTSAILDSLLMALGLTALLVSAWMLMVRPAVRGRVAFLALGQAGVGAFAFGLGGGEAAFAGSVHLVLLALTLAATAFSGRRDGGSLAAEAGLTGLPPFGVSPSLVLILLATIDRAAWVLPLLSIGLAAMAWAVIPSLPAPRWGRPRPSARWVPLTLAALLGFAMPQPLAAWLHLLSGVAR